MANKTSKTSNVMNTYASSPINFEYGEGVWLFDKNKKKYLDALCGISVTNLGHCHPSITNAIQQQSNKLLHTSNLYKISSQENLAKKLCEISEMDNVFFSNSGSEANETAIKLARLMAHKKGLKNPIILSMSGSWHGRTLATLTATGNAKIKEGFGPLPNGFTTVKFNDTESLIKIFDKQGKDICAVIIEVIQGESGINLATLEYLKTLEKLCKENDALFMVDEVQCGNGRCGNYFAYQKFDLRPDVVTTAKGLANGIPIGACLAKDNAAEVLSPGTHGSTFGGNPIACSAALASIEVIEKFELTKNALNIGNQIIQGLNNNLEEQEGVIDIRGRGLMIGIELNKDCSVLFQTALEEGLLINVTNKNIIRLLPPLIISSVEADIIVNKLSKLILNFLNN
jgi:acetylornithine/N-succinyldiaminopimelate aminotransferase